MLNAGRHVTSATLRRSYAGAVTARWTPLAAVRVSAQVTQDYRQPAPWTSRPVSFEAVRYMSTSATPATSTTPPQDKKPASGAKQETKQQAAKPTALQWTKNAVITYGGMVARFPKVAALWTWGYIKLAYTNPREFLAAVNRGWLHIKEEARFYWLGSKLLYHDIVAAIQLTSKVLKGNSLTRRERKQLLRTSADMFRLVPFAAFVIVPFLELLLPLTLKLFPNILPSTFTSAFEKEEKLKKQLQARLQLAEFLQDTVKEMATNISHRESSTAAADAKTLLNLIDDVRAGKPLPTGAILSCAKLFNDEITLDNISRPQLVAMAKYMGISAFGSDQMLRIQLRNKIRSIKEDDKAILWEGIDSLTSDEMRTACEDRGMRTVDITKWQMRWQLQQWLDLSVNQNVPATLLILSRALTITAPPMEALRESISSLESEVLHEAVLANVDPSAEDSTVRQMRLASHQYQKELIDEEAHAAQSAPRLTAPALVTPPVAQLQHVDTLTALSSMAMSSSVAQERARLETIKLTRELTEAEENLAKGRIGVAPPPSTAASASTARMERFLGSMLGKIEKDLEQVDKSIGSKLYLLDRDGDGVITADELKIAVAGVLRTEDAEQAARQLLAVLDKDKDGAVTVEDILAYSRALQDSTDPAVVPPAELYKR